MRDVDDAIDLDQAAEELLPEWDADRDEGRFCGKDAEFPRYQIHVQLVDHDEGADPLEQQCALGSNSTDYNSSSPRAP